MGLCGSHSHSWSAPPLGSHAVGAVAMWSELLSAPPLGPHAGGAVASPSAFMFAPPLGSYAGGLAASQTSASALYPPIGSHAVAMYSELVPAPSLGSHGSFFRPAPRLSHRRRDGVVFGARHLLSFASLALVRPHAGGAMALSLELDISLSRPPRL